MRITLKVGELELNVYDDEETKPNGKHAAQGNDKPSGQESATGESRPTAGFSLPVE